MCKTKRSKIPCCFQHNLLQLGVQISSAPKREHLNVPFKSLLTAFCAIFAAAVLTACGASTPDDPIAAALASKGAGEPAVWTLRDDDTTLHIMGTIHLLKPNLDWRTDAINGALNAADTIVFEADVDSQEAAAEMMKFISRKGMFTDGRQLTDTLTEAEQAQLNDALETLNLPLGAIQTMRPWFAAINLAVLQVQKGGYDPESGVERVLQAVAQADNKDFKYLETVDEQLIRLASLPDKDQVAFLVSSIEDMEEGTKMLDVLVDEWVDGDINGLAILLSNPDIIGSESVYDALLKDRNQDWTPKIIDMLETPGTRLIAVGAGHLAGDDSVINMLRKEGYTVTGP
jgi:uncharacterized protein YbaP (TraB family)